MRPLPFEFTYAMPAMCCELYLPKKAEYQGALFNALTDGFRIQVLRSHFSQNRDRILRFLSTYLPGNNHSLAELLDSFVAGPGDTLPGYSIYEVDGVFGGRNNDGDDVIFEERTQVIRFIFVPSYAELLPGLNSLPIEKLQPFRNLVRAFLSRETSSRESFISQHEERYGRLPDGLAAVIGALNEWHDRITLLLFGYVLFLICDIAREQEVWISSNLPIWVNQIRAPVAPKRLVTTGGDFAAAGEG